MTQFWIRYIGGPLDGKTEDWERAPQDHELLSWVFYPRVYEYEFRFSHGAFVFQRALPLTTPA